ncbi:MAG: nitrogenase [Scytolyngbya sp. HA4215-MV1]|jgi:tellurite resistance protein|nr:nitrogenase [Scytolyngbya sp. HA4215-MV1]
MSTVTQSSYTREQIAVWLRGLVALAWSDGHFDPEERNLIASLLDSDLTDTADLDTTPPSSDELVKAFGENSEAAENFLRTAVMVAVADGAYSVCEDKLLQKYCQALKLEGNILKTLRLALYHPENSVDRASSAQAENSPSISDTANSFYPPTHSGDPHVDVLRPVRDWLEQLDVQDASVAELICKIIPSQCPFERDINLFGRKVAHIPPLCKLNPLYEQMVSLRFRALSYLADDCGRDVSEFCQ